MLVVDKVNGLLTISNESTQDRTAYHLLTDYVRKGNYKSRRRVFIVHRLDRETSGLILFAKSEEAKRFLQDEWHGFEKRYFAVVHGSLKKREGLISSHLAENSIHRMYSVADPAKGKLARTEYRVLEESPKYSLLELRLLTGRKNQLRVHLADLGCPVTGDKWYGRKDRDGDITRLALHAASITFVHPFSREEMNVSTPVPSYFRFLMKRSQGRRDPRG